MVINTKAFFPRSVRSVEAVNSPKRGSPAPHCRTSLRQLRDKCKIARALNAISDWGNNNQHPTAAGVVIHAKNSPGNCALLMKVSLFEKTSLETAKSPVD